MRTVIIFVLCAGALSAEQHLLPKPDVPVPARFHHEQETGVQAIPEQWWRQFNNPLLNDMMERVLRNNRDVRRAAARVQEARALQGQSKSALLPSIDSGFSATELRGGFNQGVIHAVGNPSSSSFVTPFQTGLFTTSLSSRWELDVFGGLRKQLAAAKADTAGAQAALKDVMLIARTELARNYVELRGTEDQIAIVQQQVETEKDLLDLVQIRVAAGLAAELDAVRQLNQLESVRAVLPDLETQRMETMHRISVLLGEEPGEELDRLEKANRELATPSVPESLPGELLKRRPDLRRAEADIAAAYARAGAARADLYPKFVIQGLGGRQATNLSGFTFGAGNFFAIGPGISLPIFEGGRIKAQIGARNAQLEEALHVYEGEVLAAYEETENALVAREYAEQRQQTLDKARRAAQDSVALAQELYVRGLGDFLAVLDAQREQFRAARDEAAAKTVVLRQTVALYKALGV